MTTLYFRADAGTPALLLIKEYFDQSATALRAVVDFVKTRYGVSDARAYRSSGGRLLGIAAPAGMSTRDFADLLGPEWKRVDKNGVFSPYVKSKKLYQAWGELPRLMSLEGLKGELTGVMSFIHWMDGMTMHGMGVTFKTDATLAVVKLPLCVCTHKSFKPREGLIRIVDTVEADLLWKSCSEGEA